MDRAYRRKCRDTDHSLAGAGEQTNKVYALGNVLTDCTSGNPPACRILRNQMASGILDRWCASNSCWNSFRLKYSWPRIGVFHRLVVEWVPRSTSLRRQHPAGRRVVPSGARLFLIHTTLFLSRRLRSSILSSSRLVWI